MVGTSDPGSLSSCYPPRSAANNAITQRWQEDVLSNPLDGALARGPRFGGGLGHHAPGDHGHSSAQQQGPSQVSRRVLALLHACPYSSVWVPVGPDAVLRRSHGAAPSKCCCNTLTILVTSISST